VVDFDFTGHHIMAVALVAALVATSLAAFQVTWAKGNQEVAFTEDAAFVGDNLAVAFVADNLVAAFVEDIILVAAFVVDNLEEEAEDNLEQEAEESQEEAEEKEEVKRIQ
jgi:hypothetical protein